MLKALLFAIISLSATSLVFSQDSRQLQNRRVEALKQLAEMYRELIPADAAHLYSWIETMRKLIDAQLQIESSSEGRIEILRKALQSAGEIERHKELEVEIGHASQLDALEARILRLDFEIQLMGMDSDHESEHGTIAELQEQRVKAFEQKVEFCQLLFENDASTIDFVLSSRKRLADIRMESSTSNESRLEFAGESFDLAKQIEENVQARYENRNASGELRLQTIAMRLETEIMVERIRLRESDPVAQIEELQSRRIETLNSLLQVHTYTFREGISSVETLLDTTRLLTDAKLDRAKSPSQRREIIQKSIDELAQIEESVGILFDSGFAEATAPLRVESERLSYEISLLRFRAEFGDSNIPQ